MHSSIILSSFGVGTASNVSCKYLQDMHHDKSLLHNRYHVKGVYKRPFWRTRQNWSQCSWLVPRPDNQWWRVQSPSKEHWTPPGTVLVSWVWSPAIGGAVAVATLPFCLHIRPMCTATNTPALMIAVKLWLKCCCLPTKKNRALFAAIMVLNCLPYYRHWLERPASTATTMWSNWPL